MPTLPSGLRLALDTRHIMEPTTNWFRAPEGHFWYWTPDASTKGPPFEFGCNLLQDAVTAPVPRCVDEVLPFVRVLLIREDNQFYWRGETLADFPRFGDLAEADRVAWSEWAAGESCQEFLARAIAKCRVQAEANQRAQGFAVFRGAPAGPGPEP